MELILFPNDGVKILTTPIQEPLWSKMDMGDDLLVSHPVILVAIHLEMIVYSSWHKAWVLKLWAMGHMRSAEAINPAREAPPTSLYPPFSRAQDFPSGVLQAGTKR